MMKGIRLNASNVWVRASCLWLGLPLAALAATTTSSNPSNLIFRIGNFDRSLLDIASEAPRPVNFVVGKSHADKDWYGTQPAIGAEAGQASGNSEAASRVISFSLTGSPAPAYRLRIALLSINSRIPQMRVGINGKQGAFYLHPDYAGDEIVYSTSHSDLEFTFPGNYLHAGTNQITLQAIASTDQATMDVWLTYGAVELDRDEHKWNGKISSAQIEPTIFYPQGPGAPREVVDVFVQYREPVQSGSPVELSVAGRQYHQELRGHQDFGEEKLEFSVAEFSATTARAAWTAGGRRQHSEQPVAPKKKWTLFVVPHEHLDIGYSDYQAKVASVHSHVIDEAMDLTAQHPDFRFSLDGEWSLEQFLKTRAPAQMQRAIAAIQKQQLFVPANYANLLTGFPTAETLIRSLYPSANFSRIHQTPFNYATITDVPSYSWSYASVLASAGIGDLLAGSNNVRAPVLLEGRLNENSPMWWQGPDGQKVLFWSTFCYGQLHILFGLPPVAMAGRDTLPIFLHQYEHPSYHADAVVVYGSQFENTDLFPQQAKVVEEWNKVYAYPHLQYSGYHEALENIAKQFGNTIPTISGDGGPYWEDGIAANSLYSAKERQNESRGPSVEKLVTLTSLVNPLFAADKADLDRMWTNIVLMDEHTFDSQDSVSQPTSREAVGQLAVKEQYAVQAQGLIDFMARNTMASIVNSIPAPSGSLVVFNTLNWKRSGPVEIDMSKGNEIVDSSTGKVVPYEVLRSDNNLQHLLLMAQDIPPVGYKVFQLRRAQNAAAPSETAQTTTIESPYYRVTLDPETGAVRSIYDKQLQRELVNQQSPYRFGQYLYVTGGDESHNSILQYGPGYPKPELAIHFARDGSLVSVSRTPDGWVARMKSQDMNTPAIATEVRLFDKEKKIEFIEDVDKKEVYSKEAVYFAFPFAMEGPRFRYEIQNGAVDPAKDMYPGAGHEWFSVQHWVAAEQDGISGTLMPLDSPLVTLSDINRGAWPRQFGNRQGTIFSYVMNNYWFTNYAAGQGGQFRFRYIVTSAPSISDPELSRMGWEEMTPLEEDEVTTQDRSASAPPPLNGTQDSFLDVPDANLLLETWKPAEDGRGTILRFLDLGGITRTVGVQTPLLNLNEAWQTDAVERDQKQLSLLGKHGLQFTIHPHEIVTVRIIGDDVTPAPAI
jgi:alpha-mannosidase